MSLTEKQLVKLTKMSVNPHIKAKREVDTEWGNGIVTDVTIQSHSWHYKDLDSVRECVEEFRTKDQILVRSSSVRGCERIYILGGDYCTGHCFWTRVLNDDPSIATLDSLLNAITEEEYKKILEEESNEHKEHSDDPGDGQKDQEEDN